MSFKVIQPLIVSKEVTLTNFKIAKESYRIGIKKKFSITFTCEGYGEFKIFEGDEFKLTVITKAGEEKTSSVFADIRRP